jgi:hypothetical protein
MTETYNFSISSDFPNHAVNISLLRDQIEQSEISTAALDSISASGDVCGITFDGELSAGDQITLAKIVAAHEGQALSGGPFIAAFTGVKSTTATTPETALTLTIENARAGAYSVDICYSWFYTSNAGHFILKAIMDGNDAEPIFEHMETPASALPEMRIPVAVKKAVTLAAGDHSIVLKYGTSKDYKMAGIINASITVKEV